MYRLHLPRSGLHVIHAAAACALRERHRRKTAQQEPKRRAKSSQASVAVRRAVLLAWLQLSWRRPSDPAAAARFACAPSAGTRRAQSLRVRESRWREPTQPAPHRTAGAMMQRASIRARAAARLRSAGDATLPPRMRATLVCDAARCLAPPGGRCAAPLYHVVQLCSAARCGAAQRHARGAMRRTQKLSRAAEAEVLRCAPRAACRPG